MAPARGRSRVNLKMLLGVSMKMKELPSLSLMGPCLPHCLPVGRGWDGIRILYSNRFGLLSVHSGSLALWSWWGSSSATAASLLPFSSEPYPCSWQVLATWQVVIGNRSCSLPFSLDLLAPSTDSKQNHPSFTPWASRPLPGLSRCFRYPHMLFLRGFSGRN